MSETFKITSRSVQEGEMFNKKNIFKGCGGENLSPELSWSEAPKGTKSFAVTMFDPDAPTGSGWRHWLVYNISSDVMGLSEGASLSLPEGALMGKNDWGELAYGGPCPPSGHGKHRYVITVYALDTERVDLDPNKVSAAYIGFSIWQRSLAKSSITPVFETK